MLSKVQRKGKKQTKENYRKLQIIPFPIGTPPQQHEEAADVPPFSQNAFSLFAIPHESAESAKYPLRSEEYFGETATFIFDAYKINKIVSQLLVKISYPVYVDLFKKLHGQHNEYFIYEFLCAIVKVYNTFSEKNHLCKLKSFTKYLHLDETETNAFIVHVDRIIMELTNPDIHGDIEVILKELQEIHHQKNSELEGMVEFESERSRELIQQLQGIDRRIDYYENLKQSNENVPYTFLSTLGTIFGGKKNTKRRKTSRKNKKRRTSKKK
jgi:hypothetical protein